MARSLGLTALLLALAAGAATAQEGGPLLAAAELRQALLGKQHRGVTIPEDAPWSECMAPDGRTFYRLGQNDAGRAGRLRIEEPGLACFAYEDDGYAEEQCYHARRNGQGRIVFEQPGARLRFVVVESTPVQSCPKPGDLVS